MTKTIRLITDCEIECVDYEGQSPDEMFAETFKAGTVLEIDIIDHPLRMIDGELKEDKSLINVQFGDGSMAFGISTDWFEVIEE